MIKIRKAFNGFADSARKHQLAYGGNHIGRCAGALPAPPRGQAYLGVDPANPMDENYLGCIGVDIGNHRTRAAPLARSTASTPSRRSSGSASAPAWA